MIVRNAMEIAAVWFIIIFAICIFMTNINWVRIGALDRTAVVVSIFIGAAVMVMMVLGAVEVILTFCFWVWIPLKEA